MTDQDLPTANPQSLIDSALGDTTTTPMTPPPLAPLTPLAPPVTEPVVSPEPIPTPTPNVTMGDDTPLAFAMPAPSSSPTASVVATAPAPAPTMAPEQPKKKSKLGIVIGGILLLIMAVSGGVWGYQKYSVKPMVAEVGTYPNKEDCLAALSGSDGEACMNGGTVTGWHTTTCAAGYTPGTNNVGCVEASGNARSHCVDNPGTDWSCVGEGGDKTCVCCPIGTALSSTAIFYRQGHDFVNDCGAGNLRLGSVFVGVDQDEDGDDFNVYRHTCQGNACTTVGASPSPSIAPTMSCTGLSSVPDVKVTAPVAGTTVTFTCAGAVVPATAGTLSYKFRYSLNSGAYVDLPLKTGSTTTAELKSIACGSYSVECQACTTLSGVLTCDPTWTGATTP